jgi:hypothetical protein
MSDHLFSVSSDASLAEFEEKVKKLVKVNRETGHIECTLCFKKFLNHRPATDHIKTCHLDGAVFSCKFCPAVYKAKQRLFGHVYRKHRAENKLSKVFDSKQN